MKKTISLFLSVILALCLFSPLVQTEASTEYSVKAGKKITLKTNLKKAKWGSSDASVATVTKKGVVKGISEGKAVISAVAGGKTEIFSISVTEGKNLDVNDKLINAGLEAIGGMKECVTSELYAKLLYSSMDFMKDMVDVISDEDVSKPKAIYEVKADFWKILHYAVGDRPLRQIAEVYSDGQVDTENTGSLYDELEKRINELPKSVKTKLENTVISSVSNLINSKQGVEAISFASLYSDGGTLLLETLEEKRCFIFVFKSGYPVWVTFVPQDDGIVSFSAQWLIIDSSELSSEASVLKALSPDLISPFEVKKVR